MGFETQMDVKYMFYSVVSVLIGSGLATFALREWLGARIKSGIQHEYDRRLEIHRSDLKAQQDVALLNLQTAIARETSIHTAVYGAFAEGQRAAMERRLKGIDELWKAVLELRNSLPPVLTVFDVITVDEYQTIQNNPQFQALSANLSEEKIVALIQQSIEEVRPYVGEYMWAVFYCYQAILLRIALLARWGRTDKEKLEWFKDTGTRSLMASVFTPPEIEEFDRTTFGKVSWVRQRLEWKLLSGAQKVISGEIFSGATMEQAKAIQEKLEKAKVEQKRAEELSSTKNDRRTEKA